MRDKLHRSFWMFMVILFAVTALGVGVYSFWVNTHGSSNPYISCAAPTATEKFSQNSTSTKTLAGTKMIGYQPGKIQPYVSCTDFKIGTGATATASSTVTVAYTGALAKDGTIFQSSLDNGQPASLALNQTIPGWTAAIPGMKIGGERRLFIPAQYGYGAQAQAGIPANSDLVFDVTLLATK